MVTVPCSSKCVYTFRHIVHYPCLLRSGSTIASLIVELPYLRGQQQAGLRPRRHRQRRSSKLSPRADIAPVAIGQHSPNIVSLGDDDTDVKGATLFRLA